ncbi:uncharacterized protein LOC110981459 [Acanthaster planci]|uniref:Uncharacterized protein LOC110981459 n=1 Tax=Acanthaster planci TaxID=133434 RepID=A0A8B7YTV7_ACAPL|nr:uncharacterized protein LOC110981459 [Acanthaster planci]
MDQRCGRIHSTNDDSRRFSIPKVQRTPSQGCRHAVELESRQAKDILRLVNAQVLDEQQKLQQKWCVENISIVVNDKLQQDFAEKKKVLKRELSKEPAESFAFGLTVSEYEADTICSHGDFSCQSINVPLGSVDQGVNVFLFSDTVLEWAGKKGFEHPCLVIYKILKGRTKTVTQRMSSRELALEPTPNADCHITSCKPNATEPIFKQLSKSQVFLFEYDEKALLSKHPRHCLPYATISLTSKAFETYEPHCEGSIPSLRTLESPAEATCTLEKGRYLHVLSHPRKNVIPTGLERKRKADVSAISPLRRSPKSKAQLETIPQNSVGSVCKSSVEIQCTSQVFSASFSKCVNRDEKENAISQKAEGCSGGQSTEKPQGGVRMKLSDRFTNVNPCETRLEDPRLEEMRQQHLKALEKLKAVRIERINNALLGFGSSSEDETFSTIQSAHSFAMCMDSSACPESSLVTSNQTTGHGIKSQKRSLPLKSSPNGTESCYGGLKITINNSERSSENIWEAEIRNQALHEVGENDKSHGKPGQKSGISEQELEEVRCNQLTMKSTRSEKSPLQSNHCHLKVNRYHDTHKSGVRDTSVSPNRQKSPENHDCVQPKSRESSSQEVDFLKSRRYSKATKHSRSNSFFRDRENVPCRGFSHGRGYFHNRKSRGFARGRCCRGRGKVRSKCPEYFKADDTSRIFEVEEEVYEAASSKTRKPRLVGNPSPLAKYEECSALVSPKYPSCEGTQQNGQDGYGPAPYIRLQSREYSPSIEREVSLNIPCHVSPKHIYPFQSAEIVRNAAAFDLPVVVAKEFDSYKSSLGLEDISSSDSGPDADTSTGLNTDNMEVQDMDVDESSREALFGTSMLPNVWEASNAFVGQTSTIQKSAINVPLPETQSCCTFEGGSFGGLPVSNKSPLPVEQGFTFGHYKEDPSVMFSAPVQEAVNVLGQQILQASTSEQKGVLQLALENFLHKFTPGGNGSCPVEGSKCATRECSLTVDGPRNDIPSTYMNDKLICAKVAECLNHRDIKPEQPVHQNTCQANGSPSMTDSQKFKVESQFYGRPLVKTNGTPAEILMENIPGQNKPVDPRAALSALFGRKFEVDLSIVSWSTDIGDSDKSKGDPMKVETNISVQKKVQVMTEIQKDPRLRIQEQSNKSTPPPSLSIPVGSGIEESQLIPKEGISNVAQNVEAEKLHSNSPTTQFLQKLQHVSNLSVAVATLHPPRAYSISKDSDSSSGEAVKPKSHSKVSEKSSKCGGKDSRSRRYSSSSSCSGKSSHSWSHDSKSDSPTFKRISPPRRRSSHGASPERDRSPKRSRSHQSRSPLHAKSRRKSQSPQRRGSHHSKSSSYKCRLPFRRSKSQTRSRSSSAERSYHLNSSSSSDDNRKSRRERLSDIKGTAEASCGLEPVDDLYGISSKLSALRKSTNKATHQMSRFQTDRKAFKKTCFSCLGQYNNLWLKTTKTLASLMEGKSSAEESKKTTFQTSINKYEDIAANVHLQLESLVKYFSPDEIEKAGIEDWNFRPLSGVPGLSEREHMKVLRRIKDVYKQQHQTSDLKHLVREKMNLLRKKLKSSVSSHPQNQSNSTYYFPQPLAGIQSTPVTSSVMQQMHFNSSTPNMISGKSVASILPGSAQNYHGIPDCTLDRRVVLRRSAEAETPADMSHQGFATSNPAPKNSGVIQRNI